MKILVTGGAGFIGYHTCLELLKQGHEVVILDNISSGSIKNVHDLSAGNHQNITFIDGDINEDYDLDIAMEGVDSIIHLAAKVSVHESIDTPSITSYTNVQGFINVADHARQHGITRLVYASSAAIYGESSYASDSGVQNNTPISPYGLDKLTDESYAQLFNGLYKIKTIGLRYFNVYGPRQDPNSQYAGVIGKFISRAIIGLPLVIFGDGEQQRNFVYVGDIAKVNVAAATGLGGFDQFQGVVNVAKPDGEVTLNQLIDKIDKIVNLDIIRDYQSAIAGDIRISQPNLGKFRAIYADYALMRPLDDGLFHLVEYLKSGI